MTTADTTTVIDPEHVGRVRASFARQNAQGSLCALMQQTIMVMPGKEEK